MAHSSKSLDLPQFGAPTSPRRSPPDSDNATAQASSPEAAPPKPLRHQPTLPRTRRPSFSRHRNDANASRAIDLSSHLHHTVEQWYQALRQTLEAIQTVYRSGPIVEGWLEAVPDSRNHQWPQPPDTTLLRHGDPHQLAHYVETLSQQAAAGGDPNAARYRLCALDADGHIQCRPCPPEELGTISQAIARHQQLRQLINQKQTLEARLKRTAEVLSQTQKALGIPEPESPLSK